ncbi:MAG: type II toxin-antitoxin system YafQ family toxin [Defluviitaleaceae bacterium]|nr:type II toxin-antitoxin system YafQ family toxin [Defluviitaleaceae bacterium]
MKNPVYSTRFKKEYKASIKRGLDIAKLDEILIQLLKGIPLPPSNRDHPLQGNYSGCRECHIQGDWLLIYRHDGNDIVFVRTGTHSDLF